MEIILIFLLGVGICSVLALVKFVEGVIEMIKFLVSPKMIILYIIVFMIWKLLVSKFGKDICLKYLKRICVIGFAGCLLLDVIVYTPPVEKLVADHTEVIVYEITQDTTIANSKHSYDLHAGDMVAVHPLKNKLGLNKKSDSGKVRYGAAIFTGNTISSSGFDGNPISTDFATEITKSNLTVLNSYENTYSNYSTASIVDYMNNN